MKQSDIRSMNKGLPEDSNITNHHSNNNNQYNDNNLFGNDFNPVFKFLIAFVNIFRIKTDYDKIR